MAAGSGADLDRAAEGWAALTMWLHAAECAAMASRAHLLAGSRRRAAASSSRARGVPRALRRTPPARASTVTLAAPTLTRREQEVALLAADRPFEPGHRRAPVSIRAHRRHPPGPHLQQAGHYQPAGTGWGPGNVAAPTGIELSPGRRPASCSGKRQKSWLLRGPRFGTAGRHCLRQVPMWTARPGTGRSRAGCWTPPQSGGPARPG